MIAGERTIARACRVHALLRRQLPVSFRHRHGSAMSAAFGEAAAEAWRTRGRFGLTALLIREAFDLAVAGARLRVDGYPTTSKKRRQSMWNVGADLRHALRLWRRWPSFTVVTVATLALGVGAATAIWTMADGVLFRPLPHSDPDELVWIAGTSRELEGSRLPMSWPNYADLRADESAGFEDLAVYAWPNRVTVVIGDGPEAMRMVSASGNTFALLGNRAALGRTLIESDSELTAPDVVVLSDAVWRTHFGADESVIGRTVQINGREREIIGVMPPRFAFPWAHIDLWTPLRVDPAEADRDTNYLTVIGRLAEGMTLEWARPRIDAAMARLAAAYPEDNAGKGVILTARQDAVIGDARPMMLILLAASALLLLLACANLANLMLARGAVRQRELAIRTALGAGRRRLVAQLVTETVALAVLGGLIGVLVARGIVSVLLALAPPSLPRQTDIVMDVRALTFAALATLLSGVLFGLLPALKTASSDPGSALREAGRGAGAGARHHGLRALVIAQLALAMVLVSGGGLLVRSLGLLMAVDPGFDAKGVYSFRVSPPTSRYAEMSHVHAFYDALLAEVGALPGVATVGATWGLPFTQDYASGRVTIEGQPLPRGSEANMVINPVRGDYFQTLDLRLVGGRLLNRGDSENASPVVLINETAARRFWPGEEAVGKRFRRGRADETDLPWITVVGVVEDAKRSGLDSEVAPEMYWNHVQAGDWARDLTVVVRAQRDPVSLASPLRALVLRIDPQLAVTDAMLLEDRISASFAEPRFRTVLLTAIAALALLLAVVGTYGVMAFVSAQRRQEIGVRMALGADTQRVLWTVLRDGLRLIAVAAALGLVGAALSARAIATLLFGVTPFDPLAHAIAMALLVGSALLACWLPALRASRVDPLETLRNT